MGVLLTREGHEFMKYAKEVIQKADLLEAHYQKGDPSLSSFSENGKRIFWTRQHISVARVLRTEQIYRMKREFLVSKNGSMADYYATLYEWYTEKARQRLPIASDLKYPIWLYLTDDIIYQPIENTVVLELELPDDAYLLCDSEKWCYRMNYFYIPKDEEDEKNAPLRIFCHIQILNHLPKGGFCLCYFGHVSIRPYWTNWTVPDVTR